MDKDEVGGRVQGQDLGDFHREVLAWVSLFGVLDIEKAGNQETLPFLYLASSTLADR